MRLAFCLAASSSSGKRSHACWLGDLVCPCTLTQDGLCFGACGLPDCTGQLLPGSAVVTTQTTRWPVFSSRAGSMESESSAALISGRCRPDKAVGFYPREYSPSNRRSSSGSGSGSGSGSSSSSSSSRRRRRRRRSSSSSRRAFVISRVICHPGQCWSLGPVCTLCSYLCSRRVNALLVINISV